MKNIDLVLLRQNLVNYFNLEELHLLCHDLRISHENIGGKTPASFALALVEYCDRHSKISRLTQHCQELRPYVNWGEIVTTIQPNTVINDFRSDNFQISTEGSRSFLIEKFPTTLKRDVQKAKELWLLGINLERTLSTDFAKFERKLEKGDSLKILLVSPDGAASEIAVMRYYIKRNQEYVQKQIQRGLDLAADLQKIAPKKVSIRTIDFPLVFGGYALDPESTSGILYLKYYPFKVEGLPKLVFRASDGHWYDFFKSEILTLWDHATPYVPKPLRGPRRDENYGGGRGWG